MRSPRLKPVITAKPKAGPIAALLGTLLLSSATLADDLTDCMRRLLPTAEDSMTIADLRLKCQQQLAEGSVVPKQAEPEVVSERVRQDKEHVLQPFTLMSHKPNYMLLATYNFSGYDPTLYREQLNDNSLELKDAETQFQISIKTPLAVDVFDTFDIYAGYTNRSFWQVYAKSAPFRETNHEPELWLEFHPDWQLFGFTNSLNSIGVVHQSNGRGGDLSRSWNRVFANVVLEKGNFAFSFKPWYRIPEGNDDDNPDITDYMGHYEIHAAYKYGEHVFSAMSRNNLESGFSKGAIELGWSFPLGDYPYLKGYVQYFNGYGESLIDYNHDTNRIGIGLALTDWL